jgi:hypothetical protein
MAQAELLLDVLTTLTKSVFSLSSLSMKLIPESVKYESLLASASRPSNAPYASILPTFYSQAISSQAMSNIGLTRQTLNPMNF